MASIFADGFDCYAAPADSLNGYWDSGTTTSFSLQAGRFSGSQCIQSAATASPWLVKSSGANDAVHHVVCAFRQTAALSGTTLGAYLQFVDVSTNQCCIVFRSDGAMLLTSATPAGTVLDTYTGAVSATNTWTAFEIEIVINNTIGSWAVRKNGNTSNDHALGSLNTRPGTNNYANKLQLGMSALVNAQQIDDFMWRSDAASLPFVGDICCYTRMPSSDVSAVFSRHGGATNFSQVSEAHEDGAASYVFSANATDADFYGVAALSGSPLSVVCVTTRGFVQKSDASTRNAAVQLKSGATTVQTPAPALGLSWGWLWRTDTTDPATGSAWTAAGVSNVQIGPIVTV